MINDTTVADFNAIAAAYSALRPALAAVVTAIARDGNSGRALEIGSGTGAYGRALGQTHAWRVVAVDPAVAMVRGGLDIAPRLDAVVGRAETLPFSRDTFDRVFSVDVIHHVRDLDHFFREAARVLVPGGRVVTVTQSADMIQARHPLSTFWPAAAAFDLGRYPRLSELMAAQRAAGFSRQRLEVVRQSYQVTSADPYRQRVFSCLRGIPDSAFADGLTTLDAALAAGPLDTESRYIVLWGTLTAH